MFQFLGLQFRRGIESKRELVGHTSMHSYRAYLLDADGHIVDRIDLTCEDDESAKARAKEFVDRHGVELWDGGRKIATFKPSGKSPPARTGGLLNGSRDHDGAFGITALAADRYSPPADATFAKAPRLQAKEQRLVTGRGFQQPPVSPQPGPQDLRSAEKGPPA